jgi:hypothetical protein
MRHDSLGLLEFKLFGLRIAAHSSLQVCEPWQLAAMPSQSSIVRVQMDIVGYTEMEGHGWRKWLASALRLCYENPIKGVWRISITCTCIS